MGRIIAIDYGTRRTGIAVSDPLQLIAGGLATVETRELERYLTQSINTWKNGVERALKKYLPNGTEAKGQKCPNCGHETLVYQEGCLICTNCGASRCG